MSELIMTAVLALASAVMEEQPPNIILILADDQGWTGLSAQMDPDVPGSKSDFYQTPSLERLAKEGMRFSQGYAPGPVCSPTRHSIQFGMSPAKMRVTFNNASNRQLCDPELALPNLIKKADSRYATAHFGKWHAPIALVAMQAGKDVYLEKPISHVYNEGHAIIQSLKKYNRIVQHGSQMRSSPVTEQAGQLLIQGIIGEIKVARAWTAEPRSAVAPLPDSTPPSGVDFDRWLGPAPKSQVLMMEDRRRKNTSQSWFGTNENLRVEKDKDRKIEDREMLA